MELFLYYIVSILEPHLENNAVQGIWLKRLVLVCRMSKDRSTWSMIKGILKREKDVALLVDGPNILRRFNGHQVKLEDIEEAAAHLGKIVFAKVYLDTNAPSKLVQAVTNSGFEPVMSPHDLHITMAVDAYNLIYTKSVHVLAVASRHARCAPLMRKVKEKGIETAILGFEPGFAAALKNSADFVFELLPEEIESTNQKN